MTAIRALAAKDARALAWIWVAGAVTLVASATTTSRPIDGLAVIAYLVVPVALGAWAVGHEFALGSADQLLALPVSRRSVFVVKLVVLVIWLAAFAGVGVWWAGTLAPELLQRTTGSLGAFERSLLLVLPIGLALSVAPALTLATRNPLAGLVFAFGLPALFWFVGEMVGVARFGLALKSRPSIDALRFDALGVGLVLSVATAAVLLPGLFRRLEARPASSSPLALPAWRRPSGRLTRRRSGRHLALLALMRKEARTQAPSFALAGMFAVLFVALVFLERATLDVAQIDYRYAATVLYLVLLPLLVGALALAEERRFGTEAGQLLLPTSARTAFAVKVAVALGIAFVLGWLLPLGLMWISGGMGVDAGDTEFLWGRVALFVAALFVSSVARSGFAAFLLAGPVVAVVLVLFGFAREGFGFDHALYRWILAGGTVPSWVSWASAAVVSMRLRWWDLTPVFASAAPVALWYTYQNYRSSSGSLRRAVRQAAFAAAVGITIGVLFQVAWTVWVAEQYKLRRARAPQPPRALVVPAPPDSRHIQYNPPA